MKISRVRMFQVPISFGDTTYKTVGAKSHNTIDGTLIAIETADGHVGWGEVTPWGRTYLPEFAEAARAALDVLCPALIGADPRDINGIHTLMARHINGHGYAKSAIDIACWDLLGQITGLPVYQLMGGLGSSRITMNCAVYNGPLSEMVERIEIYRESPGYKIFSTKPGGDPGVDMKLYSDLAKIRNDDEVFIADANRIWTVADAIRVSRHIAPLGYNIEQPCDSYEGCLRVRRAVDAIFTLDESITDADVLARTYKDNGADIIHVKMSRIGGLAEAARFIGFCKVAGLSLSWASSGGTEIAHTAAMHAAAATPAANLWSLWDCREFNTRTFATGAPEIVDGIVTPKPAPGLGIKMDPEIEASEPIAAYS